MGVYFAQDSCLNYLFGICTVDKHLSPIIQFALVPMCTVVKVRLAGGGIYSDLGHGGLIVRPALISSGF